MAIQTDLRKLANKRIAKHSQAFFKTAKGEYGEGDVFLGIKVPAIRKIVQDYRELPLEETLTLVKSRFHEERLTGLLILAHRYTRAKSDLERNRVFKIYVNHFRYINNWDLVDATCPTIVGRHLSTKDRRVLYRWAKSKILWPRRIAIISTLAFIRKGDFKDTLALSAHLLKDPHDLMHKAVGWMLREIGKRDLNTLETFLSRHYSKMPRTMLRYAIEKLPESRRQQYLKGNV